MDGEIACLAPDGSSRFYDLLFRLEWPYFLAFDVLFIDGHDLRGLTLVQRKRRLARITPRIDSRLMLLEPIPTRGKCLYELACERDLEGIVGAWAFRSIASYVRWRAFSRSSSSANAVSDSMILSVGESSVRSRSSR